MAQATKPKKQKLVTSEKSAVDQVLVTHEIEGLTLHRKGEDTKITFQGSLKVCGKDGAAGREIVFESEFPLDGDWTEKFNIRHVLIQSARYSDDGSSAAGHVAMNAKFKALIKHILADIAETKKVSA